MRYIYKNPKECIRALTLIKEQMMYQGKDESINAIETAIGYLEVMVIQNKQERNETAQCTEE